ncbi:MULTISPECIES: DUF6350 family protein [unclassified Crossiella]|uniref:cell division protein PerM n=1 Tax=unclassified Crossiella TaxID=2620835 RepID=UPI001FFE30F7|nr:MULTISPECIES: DUF6350 family protein [unclassified Crossiella]MCK2236986.1 DUF6350 family protein [Crossiella sp. S99.2]MCK2250654.1 DUF6350 family protein [Crossiella sp. S99.1]
MTVLRPTTHGSVPGPGVAAPPATAAQQVRAALAVALGVIALGYLGSAAVIALVLAGADRAVISLEAVSAAAGPLWLAAHHVPLTIRGFALGVLPLLPTVLVFLLSAKAAGGLARRLRLSRPADAVRVIATMGVAHLVVGGMLAAFTDPPFAAAPATGALACGLIAALAATTGVARGCGLTALLRRRLGEGGYAGLRAARVALMSLCAMGALLVALALALSFGSVRGAFAELAPGIGGFGLLLVCLLYLPNAVVAALSFVAGAGFNLGAVVVSPLRVIGGLEPPFPLLAALPESGTRWWLVCLLLPIGAGVLLGWVCRRADPQPQNRVLVVGVAGAVVAAAAFVAAALTGGNLGVTSFRIQAGLLAVALFCWVAGPAAVVAWVAGPREETDEIEDEDDPEAVEEEDAEAAEDAADGAETDAEAEDAAEVAAEAVEDADEAEPVAEDEPDQEPEVAEDDAAEVTPEPEPVAEEVPPPAGEEEDFVGEEELEQALLEPPEEPGKR